jgi:hypothetical protein
MTIVLGWITNFSLPCAENTKFKVFECFHELLTNFKNTCSGRFLTLKSLPKAAEHVRFGRFYEPAWGGGDGNNANTRRLDYGYSKLECLK